MNISYLLHSIQKRPSLSAEAKRRHEFTLRADSTKTIKDIINNKHELSKIIDVAKMLIKNIVYLSLQGEY